MALNRNAVIQFVEVERQEDSYGAQLEQDRLLSDPLLASFDELISHAIYASSVRIEEAAGVIHLSEIGVADVPHHMTCLLSLIAQIKPGQRNCPPEARATVQCNSFSGVLATKSDLLSAGHCRDLSLLSFLGPSSEVGT